MRVLLIPIPAHRRCPPYYQIRARKWYVPSDGRDVTRPNHFQVLPLSP